MNLAVETEQENGWPLDCRNPADSGGAGLRCGPPRGHIPSRGACFAGSGRPCRARRNASGARRSFLGGGMSQWGAAKARRVLPPFSELAGRSSVGPAVRTAFWRGAAGPITSFHFTTARRLAHGCSHGSPSTLDSSRVTCSGPIGDYCALGSGGGRAWNAPALRRRGRVNR